jgi:hypothetical protein
MKAYWLPSLSAVVAVAAVTVAVRLGEIRASLGILGILVVAAILAIAAAVPLCVLVTRADKRRLAIEGLRKIQEQGLITEADFEHQRSQILSRSQWIAGK